MDLPKISSGMLDGLKSRFGRGKAGNDPYGGGFDDYDDFGDVDEYPDYGEYGYDEERDGGYAPASSQYDPYDTVTTRSTGEQRSMAPRLVSLSDVKRYTAVPESLVRDPLYTRAGVGRTLVDEASSGSSSSALPRSERSESLDAVFTPTASPSAAAVETPTPEPTQAPTPTPPVTPAPTEEPAASPEPAPVSPLPPWEELQRTLYETDAYCAALYLGRSGAPLADALPELLVQKGLDGVSYLADISASDCVEHAGDEVFILIPRGDRVLSLYNYVLETNDNYDAYPGALLYSSAGRCAVAVRCNESDVRPNVLAVFSGLDGDRSFSPRITLENDALLPAPGVYALTPG